jgi:hypothetical protein
MRAMRAATLMLMLLLASPAIAAPVTFEFEVVIRGIYDTNEPSVPVRADIVADLTSLGVVVGAQGQGSFGYDDQAAPVGGGNYDPTGVSFAFQVGALSASLSPGNTGGILAVALSEGNELVQLGGFVDLNGLAGEFTSGSVLLFGQPLDDWIDGSLPSTAPDLASLQPFDLAAFQDDDILTLATAFGFGFTRASSPSGPAQTVTVAAEITRLETVPEPSRMAVLALPLALLVLARRPA